MNIEIISNDGMTLHCEIKIDGKQPKGIQNIDLHIEKDNVLGSMYLYDAVGKQYKCILKSYLIKGIITEITEGENNGTKKE